MQCSTLSRSRQCIQGNCQTAISACAGGASSQTEDCDHANKGHLFIIYINDNDDWCSPFQESWSPRTTRQRSSSPPPWRTSLSPPSLGDPEPGTLWQGVFSVVECTPTPPPTAWSSNRTEMAGPHFPPHSLSPEWLTLSGILLVGSSCWEVTTVETPQSLSPVVGPPANFHWMIKSG